MKLLKKAEIDAEATAKRLSEAESEREKHTKLAKRVMHNISKQ